jgi:hypothetical protein
VLCDGSYTKDRTLKSKGYANVKRNIRKGISFRGHQACD